MHPDGPGPALVLYPPIDDEDDDDDDIDGISSLVSITSSNRPPDDSVTSNIQEELALSHLVPAVVTTSVAARGAVSKTNEGLGVAAGAAASVPSAAASTNSCMSRDLATKFDALKRRKANGDSIEACHVALAEQALTMASAEIARMQRACAELEGRLDDDGIDHEQERRGHRDRNRNAARGRGRERARQDNFNNDDGFPVLLPRVVVVTSSDHSTRDDHDLGALEEEFDQAPLDVQDGDEHLDLGGESSSDP